MGQKTYREALNLIDSKDWKSNYYFFDNKEEMRLSIAEDYKVRNYLKSKYKGISKIYIERQCDNRELTIIIYSSRVGSIIGKKGAESASLTNSLEEMTYKKVSLDIIEVKNPDLQASIVAESICEKLSRRGRFRKIMENAVESTMKAGAHGIRIEISGRLNGADIARCVKESRGAVPLSTFSKDIDIKKRAANTTYGVLGVSVWINRGDRVKAAIKR